MTSRSPLTVKLGGVAGAHADGLAVLAQQARPGWVIVHGGGAEVGDWSRRLGHEPRLVDGLRVTDDATLEVVVAVLRGLVNARLTSGLVAAGVPAIGLSGVDAALFVVQPTDPALGAVGTVTAVNVDLLDQLAGSGLVPVIAPIGADAAGRLYNVNADEAAGAIAAFRGGRLLLLTDVPGVERDGSVVATLDSAEAEAMLADGSAGGGMRPKLRAALAAADAGCEVRILDGTDALAVSAALDGRPIGTALLGHPSQPSSQPAPAMPAAEAAQ